MCIAVQEGMHFSDALLFSPSSFSGRDLFGSAICFYFQQWCSVYFLFYYTELAEKELNCGHTGESSCALSKSFLLLLLADLL